MTVDVRLLAMLVCPVCKGPLQMRHDEGGKPHELVCPADRLAYLVRDGIPVMLENEARALGAEEEAR